MHRYVFYRLLFCISFSVIELPATIAGHRKRILAFQPGSTFFYRMNYKINSLPYTTIFAQASGFKVSWKLPDTKGFQNRRSTSELHENAELLYKRHGFDGESCLKKDICQMEEYIKNRNGVISKIFKLLSRSSIGNETSIVSPLICQRYANRCPLHLIGFNDFTEH